MQKVLVSIVLAFVVSAVGISGSPAGGLTSGAPSAESPSSMVNMDSIKSGLEKVGVSPDTIAQFQKDPHASLFSAMSHLRSFVSDTATKGIATAQASANDLLETTKNLAGDHMQAINSYVDTASTAGRKAAETTRELLTKSYPNAIGLPSISLNARGSGGITGFGI